jgi:hypothetical protein
MRCMLGFCVALIVGAPAWAQNNVPGQALINQQPGVSTSVPNIQAPGAAASAVQPSTMAPATATMPGATGYTTVPTTTAPAGNMTYYYSYPARNNRMVYYPMAAPTTYYTTNANPAYVTPTQTYYTTVRRGFPFGLFRRRYVQPAYTYNTAGYVTPTYYTSPGYYYTPMTYTTPFMTTPAGTYTNGVVSQGTSVPAYTPTTYTAPNDALPAGTSTPSATTTPSGTTTTPSDTTSPSVPSPSTGSIPSRPIPPPPPVNPR